MSCNFFTKSSMRALVEISVEVAKYMGVRRLALEKIEVTSLYIKIIAAIRRFYISTAFVWLAFVFLFHIEIICQLLLFFYAPWGLYEKIAAAIGVSLVFLLLPLCLILRSFSQEKWMKALKGDEALAFALGEKSENKAT